MRELSKTKKTVRDKYDARRLLAEEEIRESERKYRELYETVKDGIVATDLEGNILECNRAYLNMLGYSAAEIKKKKCQDITPKKWHKMEARIVAKHVKVRGYSDEYEKEYIKKNGTVFPITIRVLLKKDRGGKPTGMWAVVKDITERKRAEKALRESEEKYKRLLEYSGSAMVVIEKDKTISFVNREFEKLSGYSKEEIEGKRTFLDLLPKKEKQRMARYHEERRRGGKAPTTYQFESFDKKGKPKIIEVTVAMVPGTDKSTAALKDITERKKLEKELKELKQRVKEPRKMRAKPKG